MHERRELPLDCRKVFPQNLEAVDGVTLSSTPLDDNHTIAAKMMRQSLTGLARAFLARPATQPVRVVIQSTSQRCASTP